METYLTLLNNDNIFGVIGFLLIASINILLLIEVTKWIIKFLSSQFKKSKQTTRTVEREEPKIPRKQEELFRAVEINDIDTLTNLIDNGVDINYRDKNNEYNTPLHIACMKGNLEAVKVLINNNAKFIDNIIDYYPIGVREYDKAHREEYPKTPLFYAVKNNHLDVARFLIESGIDPGYDLFCAVAMSKYNPVHTEANYMEIVERLFKTGVNVDSLTNHDKWALFYKSSSLHIAAKDNNYKLVDLLIEAGANVNIKGGADEITPLHLAVKGYCLYSAKLLLEAGADVTIENKFKITPLDIAKTEKNHYMVQLLEKYQ